MSYTFRSTNKDGTINEIELTAEQAFDLGNGRAIAYFPRDQRIAVDEHGTIVHRESAVPQQLDEAA